MPLRGVPVADAARVATAPSGFREPTLHHDLGGLEKSAEQLLTHYYMLGTFLGGVKRKLIKSDVPASRTRPNLRPSACCSPYFAPESS
jgi:hypothetical protein